VYLATCSEEGELVWHDVGGVEEAADTVGFAGAGGCAHDVVGCGGGGEDVGVDLLVQLS